MRPLLAAGIIPIMMLLALNAPSATARQQCSISMTAEPAVVHFPYNLPPTDKVTFGQLINANYSSDLTGKVLLVQYQSGSEWLYLQNFTGNEVHFTRVYLGLNTAWAHPGMNTVRVVSGGCVSSSVSFTILIDQNAAGMDLAVYATLAALAVGYLFAAKRLSFFAFLPLATAIYLTIAPFTGQRYDIYFLISSGVRLLQHVSPFDPGNPPIYPPPLKWAYPPLYAVYSAVSYAVYQLFTGSSLPSVSALTYPGWLTATYSVWRAFVPTSLPLLVFLLKLPMIVSALATGVLLAKMVDRRTAAVLWVANPLVILVAAIWGQLDPIAAFLAVASVFYFNMGKPYHAYFMASMGAAVKIWPALIIPILLAVNLRREGRRAIKPLAAVLPALILTVGLYSLYGNLLETLFVFAYARGIPTYAGQFSVNGLTWQQILFALHAPPVPLFLVLGIPAYLAMLAWIYYRNDSDITKWVTISILILFLTYNYVNPQYFYWIVPMLIIDGRKVAVWIFSVLPLAYVALSYNIFQFVSPAILYDQYSLAPSIVEQIKLGYFYTSLTPYLILAALVPTAIYGWLLLHQLRRKSETYEGLAAEYRTDRGRRRGVS